MPRDYDPARHRKPLPLDGTPRLVPGAAGRRRSGGGGPEPGDPAWLAERAARVEALRLEVERELAERRAAGKPL
jgi:hypothetical protein